MTVSAITEMYRKQPRTDLVMYAYRWTWTAT